MQSTATPPGTAPTATFGLLLNLGTNLASTEDGVFRFTAEQAASAACHGFHNLWVTERHFIPFGVNPSALTTSAFLLGQVPELRVSTAVTTWWPLVCLAWPRMGNTGTRVAPRRSRHCVIGQTILPTIRGNRRWLTSKRIRCSEPRSCPWRGNC